MSHLVKVMFFYGNIVEHLGRLHRTCIEILGRKFAKTESNLFNEPMMIFIQGSIGAKIMRVKRKALRKTLPAKCYGGDISRSENCRKTEKKERSAGAKGGMWNSAGSFMTF